MNVNIDEAREWINSADALLISASNGLSIAEGYNLFADNEMFKNQFGDYRERFGVRSVLEGASYPYPSEAERKAFYQRLRRHWVEEYVPSATMMSLKQMVSDKDYFIVTSNGDMHLEKTGFDEQRIFEVEGNFMNEFMPDQQEMQRKNERLQWFLAQYESHNLVIVELGIGARNRLIKQPLMQFVAQHDNVRYITLNLENEINVPQNIELQSIALAGDIAVTLQYLAV